MLETQVFVHESVIRAHLAFVQRAVLSIEFVAIAAAFRVTLTPNAQRWMLLIDKPHAVLCCTLFHLGVFLSKFCVHFNEDATGSLFSKL
jgi:hypothetical protein